MSVAVLCTHMLPVLSDALALWPWQPGEQHCPILCLGPCLELPVLWCAVLSYAALFPNVSLQCSYLEAGSFHYQFPITSLPPFLCLVHPPTAPTIRDRDGPNTASSHRCLLTANMNPLQLSAPMCQSCPVVAWQSGG